MAMSVVVPRPRFEEEVYTMDWMIDPSAHTRP